MTTYRHDLDAAHQRIGDLEDALAAERARAADAARAGFQRRRRVMWTAGTIVIGCSVVAAVLSCFRLDVVSRTVLIFAASFGISSFAAERQRTSTPADAQLAVRRAFVMISAIACVAILLILAVAGHWQGGMFVLPIPLLMVMGVLHWEKQRRSRLAAGRTLDARRAPSRRTSDAPRAKRRHAIRRNRSRSADRGGPTGAARLAPFAVTKETGRSASSARHPPLPPRAKGPAHEHVTERTGVGREEATNIVTMRERTTRSGGRLLSVRIAPQTETRSSETSMRSGIRSVARPT